MAEDLYKEAGAWGLQKAREELAPIDENASTLEKLDLVEKMYTSALYWTAWWSGRRGTEALLIKAREIGVTPEQWEALRATAAEVAYD